MAMKSWLGRLEDGVKAARAAMRFGGHSYASWGGYGGYWGRGSAETNYAQAVGDPLDNSIVAATVGWIGRTFPEAPIRVMRETASGEEVRPGHPLTLKLRRPNPYYSGSLLWVPMMMSWILDGNAYLIKERTNGGDVLNLWYVPHWAMEPRWSSSSEYVSYYDYKVDGQTTRYDPGEVVHLKNGLDPRNTRKGISQIKAVIREIYSDNMATQYSAAMTSNYGTPGAIISPANADQGFSPENAAVIKQNYIEKTTGGRRGEPVIFLDPVKIDNPFFSPQQMNIRETQYTPEERIAAVIGVPAIVIGLGAGLQRSTFANTGQAYEAAYRSYLIPVQRMIAEELTTQLLPDFGGATDERVEFDYTDIRALQPDMTEMARYAQIIFAGGIADRAEVRAKLDLAVRPEDKNVFYLPRGGSFSSGAIAEPIAPQTIPANTEPGASSPPPAVSNGNGKKPTDAAALAAVAKATTTT